MTAELRIAVVGLAAFATVGAIATCLVPLLAPRVAAGGAARRAKRLAALRLLPATAGLAAAAVVTSAFLAFEPRWSGEDIGVATPALAALAVVLLVSAGWRWARVVLATRQTIAGWMATAEPISLPGISVPAFAVTADFPIVAVVGVRRPRLIIERSVMASCSADELLAVAAHEQGHLDRRDNLRRLLLSVTPDVLAWLPASERLFTAWRDAAEEAADDDSARSGADGRVRLASALVKVARLAPAAPASGLMPASALYRGESLERRVRRLLESADAGAAPPHPVWRTRVALATFVTAAVSSLEAVHGIVEQILHALP